MRLGRREWRMAPSSVVPLALSSPLFYCRSGWIDNPTLDQIHIQRFSKVICQAIDARVALRVDIHVRGRGREIDRGARGLDEPMTKIVVVEEAVNVGAKDAA